ncbi:hypothetical protein [Pedobacter suwonensis]|uniref:hypothetical protein n=1 Tax=Pedobacter suwonensis TaxID=332999 RepID=UPI0036B5ECC9
MTLLTIDPRIFESGFFQINPSPPSITDWIQAIGVILASIGLFINFYYQRKALREQYKVREIEEDRDRRAIMPWIEMESEYSELDESFVLSFKCVSNDGNLLFISPVIQEMNAYNLVENSFKAGQTFILRIPGVIVDQYSAALGQDRKFYKVQYFDKEHRPYEQWVYLVGRQIYITDPVQYMHVMMMEEYEKRKSRRWKRFFKSRPN